MKKKKNYSNYVFFPNTVESTIVELKQSLKKERQQRNHYN